MRLFALAILIALAGCGSTKPDSQAKADTLDAECNAAIQRGKAAGATKWFESAYGYAVFPEIGKAGFIVGGAYGKGQVYGQGKVVGFCAITQGTVGLQIGAQSFSPTVIMTVAVVVRVGMVVRLAGRMSLGFVGVLGHLWSSRQGMTAIVPTIPAS